MAPLAVAIPLAAGLVAALFAGLVWTRWGTRRTPHGLAWGLGLTAYAAASLIEATVAANGWTIPLYRAYFPLAATLVGLLGLGTVLMSAPPRVARAFTVFVAASFLVAAFGPLTLALTPDTLVGAEDAARPLSEWGSDLGGKAVPFPHPARFAFLALNVVGGLALMGGAALGWWRSRRAGLLLIGVGALVPFTGGALSTLGVPEARVTAQLLGVVVMFAGYAASTFTRAGTAPSLAAAVEE